MATKAEVAAQMSSTQTQINNTQSQLSSINEKLIKVGEAKKEIAGLKGRADGQKTALGKLDCEDKSYWKGSKRDSVVDNYSQSKKEAKTYYNGLDKLADDLVNLETSLVKEQAKLNGNLNSLNSTYYDLRGLFEKLFN